MNLFGSGYRRFKNALRGPVPALVSHSAPVFHNRGSIGSLQHQHFPQVVTDSFQPQVIKVAPQTQIATSGHPVAPLQSADDPLHGLTQAGKELAFLLMLSKAAFRAAWV